jgi:FMN phosphatase YigB (HAD superfamily)
MEPKKRDVFLDASFVLEPNKTERGEFVASYPAKPSKNWLKRKASLTGLSITLGKHFGSICPSTIQRKYFDELRPIPLEKEYPEVIYEGDILPPIMVAWLIGDLTPVQIKERTAEFFKSQEISSGKKNLFEAMTHATFDSEIMKQTAQMTPAAKNFLQNHKDHVTAYLIGNLTERIVPLKKKDAELYEQFEDRIYISGEVGIASPTPEFFTQGTKTFPGSPENRIYIVAESPAERTGSYFDAAHKFSHHIHRTQSTELETLLKQK